MKKFLSKLTTISVLLFFVFLTGPGQIFAAGTINPTGTQGTTGIVNPTGPQNPVGPTVPTGAISATELSAINSTTGPDSDNNQATQSSNDSTIDLENNSDTNNTADIQVDTGSNTIGSNTSAGNVATGDANVGLNIINASNSILNPNSTYGSSNVSGGTNLSLGKPTNQVSFENFLTGPGSENSNLIDANGSLAISEINNSDIDNEIRVDINTGENQVNGNTCIGDLITGDINACINLLNLSNIIDPLLTIAVDSWNILGDVNGAITFENTATGCESSNNNELNSNNDVNITSTNNSNIINNAEVSTNTGENTTSNNTVVGDIQTGIANVKESIVNFANIITSPVFYVFNIFGQFTGDIASLGLDPNYVFLNELTGPGSENSNIVNQSNDLNIDQENNSNIENNISINANTGHNSVGSNTVAGNINTGNINVGLNVINLSNILGKDAKNFCIRIINIFGNWNCDNGNQDNDTDNPGENNNPGDGGTVTPPAVLPEQLQQAVLGNQLSRVTTPAIKTVALVKGEELGNPPVAGPENNYNQLMYALIILLGISGLWAGFEILSYKKK